MCFLADSQYDEECLESINHRTNPLSWCGIQRELEFRIRETGDVTKVIEEEILDFRLKSLYVIPELRKVGSREQIKRMAVTVENFIIHSIRNMYD